MARQKAYYLIEAVFHLHALLSNRIGADLGRDFRLGGRPLIARAHASSRAEPAGVNLRKSKER